MKTKNYLETILEEISSVLKEIDENQVNALISSIKAADKIVVCGAGRVGMAIRGFGMRLAHLGLNAFTLGDSVVPGIGPNDLLIVASGSGETRTILDLVKIAKKNGSTISLVTGNELSSMGVLANYVTVLKAPSKTKQVAGLSSIQPMTTLNEQCLGLFFDAVVLKIMEEINETHETMWARHSNLE